MDIGESQFERLECECESRGNRVDLSVFLLDFLHVAFCILEFLGLSFLLDVRHIGYTVGNKKALILFLQHLGLALR